MGNGGTGELIGKWALQLKTGNIRNVVGSARFGLGAGIIGHGTDRVSGTEIINLISYVQCGLKGRAIDVT